MADHIHHAQEPLGDDVVWVIVGFIGVDFHLDLLDAIGPVKQKLADIFDSESSI